MCKSKVQCVCVWARGCISRLWGCTAVGNCAVGAGGSARARERTNKKRVGNEEKNGAERGEVEAISETVRKDKCKSSEPFLC